jgi:PAS domain S-box-containing protein
MGLGSLFNEPHVLSFSPAILQFSLNISNFLRAHFARFSDAAVTLIFMAAVSFITWFVTKTRGRGAMMESLFEQAPPTAIMSPSHRVLRINREFTNLFGYTPEETAGRALEELIVPAAEHEEYEKQVARVAAGERVDAEVVRRSKDGTLMHILLVTVPVSAPNGQISIYALHRDITKRKTAELSLQAVSRRLLEVQEDERRRLSRELHDEIGQSLTVLGFSLGTSRASAPEAIKNELDASRQIVDDLLSRVRRLSFDLRPADLDRFGLRHALLSLFERFTAQTGILVDFKHNGIENRLPAEVETGAYRIVQESLTNAARHARVDRVFAKVWAEPGRLHVQVEDRGAGFDPEVVWDAARSSGMVGMKERTFLLGGRLIVDSAPGCGTTIAAQFPLNGENLSLRDGEVLSS